MRIGRTDAPDGPNPLGGWATQAGWTDGRRASRLAWFVSLPRPPYARRPVIRAADSVPRTARRTGGGILTAGTGIEVRSTTAWAVPWTSGRGPSRWLRPRSAVGIARRHENRIVGRQSVRREIGEESSTMRATFQTVDVFTDRQFGGNPVAVVSDARGLSEAQMQTIANEFNLAETTFVLPPEDPANTARVRIFTPARRDAVCGPSKHWHGVCPGAPRHGLRRQFQSPANDFRGNSGTRPNDDRQRRRRNRRRVLGCAPAVSSHSEFRRCDDRASVLARLVRY